MPPPPPAVTVTAPQISQADRAPCGAGLRAKMTRNPYANTDLLIGALKICSIRKDHVIGAFDDLAAVAAGKGVVLK